MRGKLQRDGGRNGAGDQAQAVEERRINGERREMGGGITEERGR